MIEVAGHRAAVLGSPIGHSLSPVLHRAAYAWLDLAWSYDAIECDEAGLAAFLDGAAEFSGLSLTMPLKRIALPLLDDVAPLAAAVGAVNTVTFGAPDGAGRRSRRGDNTDVAGMVGAIRASEHAASQGPIVILGAGGTAAAALAASRELGRQDVRVVVRDRQRAADVMAAADNLGVEVDLLDWPAQAAISDASIVISTVPAGAADQLVEASLSLHRGQLIFDVLYHAWPTMLAVEAARAGAAVIGGLELLVRQAAIQVELMTGRPGPIDVMRAAGADALAARDVEARR